MVHGFGRLVQLLPRPGTFSMKVNPFYLPREFNSIMPAAYIPPQTDVRSHLRNNTLWSVNTRRCTPMLEEDTYKLPYVSCNTDYESTSVDGISSFRGVCRSSPCLHVGKSTAWLCSFFLLKCISGEADCTKLVREGREVTLQMFYLDG